jgi:broad specificity phosphatase PhoE
MGADKSRATKVMLIRHAEKPQDSSRPYGVTAEGEREKESLTVRGWQRAGALVHLFAPADGRPQDRSLARPQFLYASKPKKQNGSRRPVETLTPLAEKLAIRINCNFMRFETGGMLEEVRACVGVVLISWQHNYLPEIANGLLGDEKTVPQQWPEDRYDMVWVLDLDPTSGRYNFKQVPQLLLMGDWATPIR